MPEGSLPSSFPTLAVFHRNRDAVLSLCSPAGQPLVLHSAPYWECFPCPFFLPLDFGVAISSSRPPPSFCLIA